MAKAKKYIFVIVIVLAIVSVSFIERNTVFDSMIITGLAVEIEGGRETYYLEYLSKEKNNIYVIQSDIMSIKKDVKKATGKDVTFSHCTSVIIQKKPNMYEILCKLIQEKEIDLSALIVSSESPKETINAKIKEDSVSMFIEKAYGREKVTLRDFLISKAQKKSISILTIKIENNSLIYDGEFELFAN